MKILTIDWERKIIEEIETDSIRYEKDGVSYAYALSTGIKTHRVVPFENFLGIKEK